jgi:hypothetical protein
MANVAISFAAYPRLSLAFFLWFGLLSFALRIFAANDLNQQNLPQNQRLLNV